MYDNKSLSTLVDELTKGWSEKIEFSVRRKVHDGSCQEIQEGMTIPQLRHLTCVCPEVVEKRSENRKQAPLITQLVESMYHVPTPSRDDAGGGGGGKPKSKPPGNLLRPELLLYGLAVNAQSICASWLGIDVGAQIDKIGDVLKLLVVTSRNRTQDEIDDATHLIQRVVQKIRQNLGYDSSSSLFAQTVCSSCGGGLRVDADRPTDVRCAGTPSKPPCGERYPWHTWGELLAAGPVLADTDTAVACIGRKRGTLYYWASKGYVTRYGTSDRGGARWDLDELRRYAEGLDKRGPKAPR